jgi:hypothetical protein
MAETQFFRASGGLLLELDVPLNENMQQQVDRRELVRVNPDGSPYGSLDSAGDELQLPSKAAPKNEWVGYAVSQGMSVDDADAMTKNDLIEKFGEK